MDPLLSRITIDPATFTPAGLTRRQMLRRGLALGAFLLPQTSKGAGATPPRRRARGTILIMLEGGMSHLDTWDPKPKAPAEIRGEFGTIATTVPGLRIAEYMPMLARQAHRYNLVRSVHCDARNDHSPGMHLLLTGWEKRLRQIEPDSAKTFWVEASRDYSEVHEIWSAF